MKARVLVIVGAAALTASALTTAHAGASTPADSGTLTPAESGTVSASWTGMVSGANQNSDCTQSASPSLNDHHTVTIALPTPDFYKTHTVTATFRLTPSATLDVIESLQKGGASVNSSDNGLVGQNETVSLTNPDPATYDDIACAASGTGTYTGTVTLTTAALLSGTTPGGYSASASGTTYGDYVTPSYGSNAGEPTIGSDWKTGAVLFEAGTTTIKALFPSDGSAPAFSDVSAPNAVTSLDPALFTDSVQGRTFTDQLLTASSALAYTDNDGMSYTPGAQTLTPGVDHQTIGAGPYPSPLPTGVLGPVTSFPDAVYYCSQGIAAAFCQRSDNGGLVFQNAMPMYTVADGCGGLHGHVRVAPDGTVYVPNKSCNGHQAVAVSTNAGQSFTVHDVTGSTPGSSDPSVAVGKDGTVYFAWENGDNHPLVSVSHDKGLTWTTPVDVGASLSIASGVFPTIIAGDGDRAAFAFLGTTTTGDPNVNTFGESADGATYTGGSWYHYIATTVDGGSTWNTVNDTPGDPVQRGSICQAGTTCPSSPNTRNLLDYMDITVDKEGRALAAFADGCTGACVTSNKVGDNTLTSQGVIVRQTGGPLLFEQPATAQPAASLPEVPFNLLLPLVGLGVIGGVAGVATRRRRTA